MTGGRLLRVKAASFRDEKAFCFTYGDGVSNVDISDTNPKFHKRLTVEDGHADCGLRPWPLRRAAHRERTGSWRFKEKPKGDGAMINAGFFVLSPRRVSILSEGRRTRLGG